MEENYIKVIEDKVKQYDDDLKKVIQISSKVDKVKTAKIKVKFEDLVTDEIKELIEMINGLKEYIKTEKQNKK